jgi:DNA-binding transcriptional ArsR family regulator
MGSMKAERFTQEQRALSSVLKALAHPARIAILEHLIEANACVCGDLVEALPLAQSTVSQHLKELKRAGLIKGRVEGTSVCYCIDAEAWQATGHLVQDLFDRPAKPLSCC